MPNHSFTDDHDEDEGEEEKGGGESWGGRKRRRKQLLESKNFLIAVLPAASKMVPGTHRLSVNTLTNHVRICVPRF